MEDLPKTKAYLASGLIMDNVHNPRLCYGTVCVVHNPTDHHMKDWPQVWRGDRAIFERLCPHGIGHPDPDQESYWRSIGREDEGIHGCDGCC